jgi:transposase
VDEQERPVLRRELKRHKLEAFFQKLPGTEVVLEACGGSHHWARVIQSMGHRVRLIPPQYVKPFLKRSKNDDKDAEAINEAAARPSMRSVAVKTVDQQAKGIIVKHRKMLVVGAMSVIRFAKPGSKSASPWLLQLLERKPRKLAAVALANKMARIIWAMMARGEASASAGHRLNRAPSLRV